MHDKTDRTHLTCFLEQGTTLAWQGLGFFITGDPYLCTLPSSGLSKSLRGAL